MVHFVGAGPGAVDLISVRGARLLGEADLVIYAGSLVNPELLEMCRPDCACLDSSRMTLDEIVRAMATCEGKGGTCVRLHTGDPALFGAHREQMERLDELGIAYDVVPGVSSLFAAAAALGAEYTVPELTQTLIVTRVEGRTPVPDTERLSELAAHGSSIALFLSAGLLDKAQEELLAGGLAVETPAAIVVRASWPDEAAYRCTVGTLAACGQEHDVTRTALVLVGGFLAAGGARSRLYDASFGHGFRPAMEADS